MQEVNFVGVRGPRAAIFMNSRKAAEDLVLACHLRVLRGSLVRCKTSTTAEMDSSSDLPVDVARGEVVKILGLQSDAGVKLNGLYGRVTSYDVAKGRFVVSIHQQANPVSLTPEHVMRAMRDDDMSDE